MNTRMRAVRMGMAALAGAVMAASPVDARALWETTAQACTDVRTNPAELAAAIAPVGWAVVQPDMLDDALIARLAAASLYQSIMDHETPSAALQGAWDLALKSARGVVRLVAIPDAPVQRHYFVHPQSGSVMTVHTEAAGRVRTRVCRIALTTEAMWNDAKGLAKTGETRRVISRIPASGPRAKDAGLAFFYYDVAAFQQVLGLQMPINGVVETYLRTPLQEVTP